MDGASEAPAHRANGLVLLCAPDVPRRREGPWPREVVRLVDGAEYKRRQMPPGVRITTKAFGKDRRMPITNHYRAAPGGGATGG